MKTYADSEVNNKLSKLGELFTLITAKNLENKLAELRKGVHARMQVAPTEELLELQKKIADLKVKVEPWQP